MSTPPPNWYPDPADATRQRYWDGTRWTKQLRALDAAAPVEPAYVPLPPLPTRRGRKLAAQRLILIPGAVAGILAGIAFAFTGGLFLSSALRSVDPSAPLGSGAVSTTAEVIAVQSDSGGCTPIAKFEVDGVVYTATSRVTYSPCGTDVGDEATVSYLPDDIGGTAILSFPTPVGLLYALIPGLIILFGIAVAISCLVQLIRMLRGALIS